MKSRDDLISVLNLGWETARRAWRLLAPDVEFTVDSVGTSGRDMDQVAYDLRRLGYGKPARLAFSVAFILNGLASRTIEDDRDLAEKASQIVSILAEMLLELEATSQVTAQEPADIVELLQSRWGLVLWTEDHAAPGLPRPHFRVESPLKQAADEVLTGVAEISDALILASESLLHRAESDGDFPYLPSLSRIHHLGMLIRDRLAAHLPVKTAMVSGAVENHTQCVSQPEMIEVLPENESSEPGVRLVETTTTEPFTATSLGVQAFANRIPNVLIIDESPFFRMLLTSAIESAGYETQVVGSILEARQSDGAANWDLILCSANQIAGDDAKFDWLQSSSAGAILLESNLTSSNSQEDGHVQRVPRADIAGLLAVVKSMLGPGTRDIRLSA